MSEPDSCTCIHFERRPSGIQTMPMFVGCPVHDKGGKYITEELVTTADGFQMYLDPEDHFICESIRKTGMWEPTVRRAILDYIGPDDYFLDLGAHVGYFSLQVANLGVKVTAVEPNPTAFDLMVKSRDLNGFDINCVQGAVGPESGRGSLFRYAGNTGMSYVAHKPYHGTIAIDILDIHNFLEPVPTFIKMDIEGDELPVLRACPELLDSAEVVIFETHEQENPEEAATMLRFMKTAGLTCQKLHDTGIYQDWLAVREE